MLAESRLGIFVVRKKFNISSRNTAAQLGSSTTMGMLRTISRRRAIKNFAANSAPPDRAFRSRKAAGRSRAARGTTTWKPAVSNTSTAAFAELREEMIVERVGPEDHRPAACLRIGRLKNHSLNVCLANARHFSLRERSRRSI